MLVEATAIGFYVKLRKPGDQFDVTEALFSATWMKRVEVAEAPVETPEPETPVETPAVSVEPIVKKRRGRKPKVVSE